MRTNVLVAVGASAFVDLANHLAGADGSVRVIAYVVSGIGFLGAGAIMKEGMNARGLNTAATLWLLWLWDLVRAPTWWRNPPR